MRHYPFAIHEGTNAERRQDYHNVAELLVTGDLPKLFGCPPATAPCPAHNLYWSSLNLVLRRQARFLSWFFATITLEGLLFGWLASNYGNWHNRNRSRSLLAAALLRLYEVFTRKFILPNLSEWHVLLTNFNWPKGVLLVADVLQNHDHLYPRRV